MRALSFIAALGIPFLADASFDLMLIPSNTGNTVVRYDPINGVALGSFSVPLPTITSVAAVAGSSTAVVNIGSGSSTVNYHTGERYNTGGSPTNPAILSSDGTRWLEVTTGNQLRYGLVSDLSVQGTFSTSLVTSGSIVQNTPTTVIINGKNAAGDLVVTSQNAFTSGGGTGLLVLAAASDIVAGSNVGQLALFKLYGQKWIGCTYRSVTFGHRFVCAPINADGTLPVSLPIFAVNLSSQFATTSATSSVAAVAGHDGVFLVGADASGTGTRFVEVGAGGAGGAPFIASNTLNTSFTAPSARRWQMANVVAPEPGTMAALGLGIAALLKRRRR